MSTVAKLAATITFILALCASYWYVYGRGIRNGTNAERVVWQDKETKRADAEKVAILDNQKTNAAKAKADDEKNLRGQQDHEAAIAKVNVELRTIRADVQRNGGMRVPASICRGNGVSAPPSSNGGPVDPLAGTVELPQQYQDAIWAEAERAEKLNSFAHACQARVKEELQESQ